MFLEGLKHFSCHTVLVRVTKCPFSHPHLIPSWQPPPSHLLVAGLGRALGPAHITACHLAAPEEVGAQSPDPGTLCCLPQSWEGRPARAGHSQPQHSDTDTFRIFQCLHFLLRGASMS